MSTRSLTHFIDQGVPLCTVYRHCDGYPSGHGTELAEWLDGFKIVNGFTCSEKSKKVANDMGCLAAQMLAHFKTEVGQFYIYPAGTKDKDCDAEYIYTVMARGAVAFDSPSVPILRIRESGGKDLFAGSPDSVARAIAAEEAKNA